MSIATIGQPLKARLPKIWDLFSVEEDNEYCQNPLNSCPEWITNGLEQYSTYYSNNDHVLGIKGYWLLGSYDFSLGNAMAIYFPGTMNPILTSNDNEFGIRPVITVSKLDLSK